MEVLVQFLSILLPASIVLVGMFLTARAFLNKEFEKKLLDIRTKSAETILPIRLQAYERICLLLERSKPNNLVLRVNNPDYNAAQLHQRLLKEVRDEVNHNLSQQVYMSIRAWEMVKFAVEDVNKTINSASEEVKPDAKSIDLARKIMEKQMSKSNDATDEALRFVKKEIQQFF